ncbi:Iron complex outermembrane recepter protein [Cupriavidus taiwanensis]|uniref:Iron complex outermembrane recepter protein n=1 Tax=Cupriavidus taiwanensis TaxID=164546 RepID=A0A9Q7UTL3_9BURK|nr:TonB-dependent siderophore receptor [Cupriavidus taiwanensis]SPD64392.1 Iron complex outermembrane recepter protein [Cupriavidus taiwanensis]
MPSFRSSARRLAHHACHAGLFLLPLSDAALAEPPGLAADLPEVRVSASAGGSGYLAVDAAGATRTDTPLREVPQSVRVVTSELIDDLGATRLADTVDYVSGIARLNDFGGTWDNYAIRGFSSTEMGYLVNGFPGSRGYNPMRDAATVERFEFLKGPAAALYGSSEPGGTINIVTKKPRFTAATAAEVSVGTLGFRRATIDTTGPLGKTLAYRLNVMAEDSASRSPLIDGHKYLVAPALTWAPDDRTLLQYEGEFMRLRTPLDRGLVNVDGRLTLPRDRYLQEPSDPNLHLFSDTHQLTLERQLSAAWRTRIGASYKESGFEGYAAEFGSLLADRRTLTRRNSWRTLPSRDTSVRAEAEGNFHAAGLGHRMLLGIEASRLFMGMDIAYSSLAANAYAIDIYEPVYGQAKPAVLPGISTRENQRNLGAYLQDEVSIDERWKLLAGVRFDNYQQSVDNLLTAASTRQSQSAVSPRIGLTWLPTPQLSAYLSFGKSFRPNSGVDEAGNAFDPQYARSIEAGLKWQSRDERLGATLALFDIRKHNVLTRSPANPNFNIATGQAASRGLEFDAFGNLDQHWRISGSFSLVNARVTEDNTIAPGTRLSNIPRISASLLAIREDAMPKFGGRYGIGTGIVYVGNRSGNASDTYSLPAYATVKLVTYWQIDRRTRLFLDIHNVFDKTYYPASWGNLAVVPGLGRQFVAGLRHRF